MNLFQKKMSSCSLKKLKEIRHKNWEKQVKRCSWLNIQYLIQLSTISRINSSKNIYLILHPSVLKTNLITNHSWISFDSEELQSYIAIHNKLNSWKLKT